MYKKRGVAYDPAGVPLRRRLRARLADNFLAGKATAQDTARLYQDAVDARAEHCQDLVRNKEPHRALLHKLKKVHKKGWPTKYWAKIRVWDKKTQQLKGVQLPLLLPHELVNALFARGDYDILMGKDHLQQADMRHLESHAASLKCSAHEIFPLTLWSDGVPCNWDRSQSLEVLTLSFPALPEEHKALRIPLFGLKKHWCATGATMDDVMQVLCWSLEALAVGCWPQTRHDGSPFQKGEHFARHTNGGRPLPCKGLLVEIRGDWKMLKDIFRLPQHNENRGMCWKCPCKPDNLREVNS